MSQIENDLIDSAHCIDEEGDTEADSEGIYRVRLGIRFRARLGVV